MRPLHLQSTRSPRATPVQSPSAAAEEPYSPSPPSSRYASAEGLNELVKSEEEKESREEDGDGDEMIDSKAEEFIAQFYQQMRLQRFDSMDRDYIERSNRSLGS
uniref:DUF761 domain-containing protein n=2 Tax=Cajanus cajan TaxID=3821 RepID=A0A151RYC0_CAJCA|nr:hypothetical protein KK1_030750 [Cajanus cajan]